MNFQVHFDIASQPLYNSCKYEASKTKKIQIIQSFTFSPQLCETNIVSWLRKIQHNILADFIFVKHLKYKLNPLEKGEFGFNNFTATIINLKAIIIKVNKYNTHIQYKV